MEQFEFHKRAQKLLFYLRHSMYKNKDIKNTFLADMSAKMSAKNASLGGKTPFFS